MENKDIEVLEKLTKAINRVYEKPILLHTRYFFLGISYGLGATIGVAIVLAFLAYALRAMGGLPVIGGWLNGLSQNIPVSNINL